jgi:hypothetical protein
MNLNFKIKKAFVLFFIVILSMLSNRFAHAASWPIFSAPNQAYLLNHHYIDTRQCPPGHGRLINNITVNIRRENLCYPNCPTDWSWISTSDNRCHALATEFSLQEYNIVRIKSENGTTSYSQITAYFGKKGTHQHAYTFVFNSAEGDHWECYVMNPESHLITCAKDS